MASKKSLEIFLAGLEKKGQGLFDLQQYPTPSHIAADMLWSAFMSNDIKSRTVADLGSGNGILAIGAKMLGAEKVYGVEKDRRMVEIAERNAEGMGIEFLHMDIADFDKRVDTIVMNPPFGKKPRHMDRHFLLKAFETAKIVYSIHTANSWDFLRGFAEKNGFFPRKMKEFDFPVRRAFQWHRKPVKAFRAAMVVFTHKPLKKEE